MDAIEREIIERFRKLLPEQQRQVRDFVARFAAGHPAATDVRDHALSEWLSPEEDAAWAHLQDPKVPDQVAPEPRPASGKDLGTLAGTITSEDLDVMERVIEEDCERIDLERW
jgi:hypothetical protein